MPAFKRPESVLVVVHTVDGLVLMLERVSPPRFWQSVTGSLEPDESFEAAARRELTEETGLTDSAGLVDLNLPQRFRIASPWRKRFAPGVTHNLERAFALAVPTAFEPALDPSEHRRYLWLPTREAVARASSWTNRKAIERIFPARAREA